MGAQSCPALGLVIKKHNKDDTTNTNGNYPEYDVLLFDTHVIITNIAVKGQKLNRDSGDEAILTVASDLPDMTDLTQAQQNFMESDGDLVIVEFISARFPIISGTMNHLKSGEDTAPWSADSTDGERRAIHHKDASFIMNEDGTIDIDLASDKELNINIDGTMVFRVKDTGSGITVDLGGGSGEKILLGESFVTWWLNNISGHTHSVVGAATGPPLAGTGALVIPNDKLSNVTKSE